MNVPGSDDAWAAQAPASRRRHRGLTLFTSLLFVFALVLGQASFAATAEEIGTEPAATETDAPDESVASEEAAPTDEPAPAEEPESDETSDSTTEETTVEGSSDEATVEETVASHVPEETSVTGSNEGSTDLRGAGSGEAAIQTGTPGSPSGNGVQPIFVDGNPGCLNVMDADDFLFEHTQDPPADATINLTFDDLSGTLTISVNEDAQTVDFSFSGDFAAAGVLVKGGSNANFYDYRPNGTTADSGLHAPINPMNGKFFGLSHLTFCIVENEQDVAPGIDVEKECVGTVEAGEDIEFTITVTNTGNEDLEAVVVSDALFGGNINDEFDLDLSAGLAVGATATATLTYSPGADESSVDNTVSASATGVTSGEDTSDSDSCTTEITPPQEGPAIQILKEGPALVHRGETITYQFEVTNTGDVELFDVELTDPRCDPGTIVEGVDVDASLAVDEVWHFTCTHLVTETDPNPIPNTATVRGDTVAGEGGEEVTDQDDHVVVVITPAISIDKTVSDNSVTPGTTVTFTYVVMNTGDTTLFDISVDDDVLGHIGDIAMLEAGASETLTATFTVESSPVTNVGTASGQDVLGETVTDTDDAFVDVVLAGGGESPSPGVGQMPPATGGATGGTAFTGSDTWIWALIAAALALIGLIVLAATRKGRGTHGSIT
jgi:uncharacterized repeat protein (TIGR01451 family)